MIHKILHPKEIETATVQINSGDKSGTAFFIDIEDEKQILLTSDHNLPSEQPISVIVNEVEVEAVILERIPERDVALLQIKIDSNQNINALPLESLQVPYNEKWETYGFPVQRVTSGGRFNGTVSRTNQGTIWDIDLDCEQYNKLDDFSGLSGSPLVINGFVVGVIGYDLTGTLAATSISCVTEKLERHNVRIEKKIERSIPNSIEKDISTATSNEEVLKKINEVIRDQITGSYFLVTGNPGSGKTTIAAQLELDDPNHIILERFFVKVPEEEIIPTQIRSQPEFFMKWMEEICFRILYNTPPPKNEKSLNERILAIHQAITHLAAYYQQQGKVAFLIIDGLDDVTPSKIENYLSVLPINLPPSIKVIFSCTSRQIVPNSFHKVIGSSKEIKVTPLSTQNAEKYLSDHLKNKTLTSNQISELAQKSEGHPLYLRYLTKYILDIEELPSVDDWIDSIPVIGGEIENYYNQIWSQLNDKTDETWLASTLSRLRIPVDEKTLSEILPEKTRHSFLSSFTKISHLLKNDNTISIYHSSFSDFIDERTGTLNEQVHKNIAQYILSNPETSFSISEKIYHLSNGNEENKRIVLDECNQTWIDTCAINSVNPDIVLADVKNVIGIAAELGIAHKVVSLLLLSQRVNFRYNTLFQENALFLVNALLALGKHEEAIRYVVRNNTLTVTDGDALYLLQRFYEYEAEKESETLLNAIIKTTKNIIETGIDSDSFSRFIHLKLSAVTLSANSDFRRAFDEFGYFKNSAIKMIESSGNPKDVIHKFKDDVGSYNSGYLIWRFEAPPFTKHTEDKFKFDQTSSGYIALSIFRALDFQEKSPITKVEDNIPLWIEDLEYVIDKYGIHPDYYVIILEVLLGRSKRIDIIESLFQELHTDEYSFDFRADNGVDLNHKAIHRFGQYAECLGFFDTTDHFPEISKYYSNWEKNIKNLFKYSCFLEGKIKRFRVEDKAIKTLKAKVVLFLENLIPKLEERIHWKRSYALPELIFPILYKKIIRQLINSFPDYVPTFVEEILSETHYQLGLYTEGYSDSLFTIARELARTPNQDVSAFKVMKVLEEHIINTVENRWERNEYLLRLIELYALLENEDKAKKVFTEMIDSSMGPSWYKEAQLGIINTSVSKVLPQKNSLTILQEFAAHLHHASGEMTFQRYVKQQQEKFVGDLAKAGFLNKSIEYFKYLLFPDYQTIIKNAESGVIDMPYKGEGYVLGARAIEEQSGVLSILKSIECKDSLIAWGICELFILGDDRYIGDYTKLQANILNNFEECESNKLDIVLKRLPRFVVTEINDEYRDEYLHGLYRELSDSNVEKVKSYLEEVGFSLSKPSKEDEEIPLSSTTDKKDPLDLLTDAKQDAQKKLNTENKSGARKIIIESLERIQNQKYGIWSSNYSSKINEIRELLSESYNQPDELIKDIKNLIINEPYFDEWIIADQIIQLLENINNEEEKQLILATVLEHINLMIRTPQATNDKYDWFNQGLDNMTCVVEEEQLLELLIWFLNHPSLVVKNRAIEVLVWLGSVIPEIITQGLMKEILSDGFRISKELSASIIHQISDLNPDGFSKSLKFNLDQNEEKLGELGHFMIRDSLIAALKNVKKHEATVMEKWLSFFEKSFTPINNSKGEVVLEDDHLDPISDYLYELNELGVLTKEFAEKLLKQIKNISSLSLIDLQKASRYIDRSFNNYNDIDLVPEFDSLLRYALNIALTSCVTLEDSESVASIMRFYQPTFPENKLISSLNVQKEMFENAITDIFEEKNVDLNKMLINGDFPINFNIKKYSESRTGVRSEIELTSYLIPIDKYSSKGHSYPSPIFAANNYPTIINSGEDENVIPLFIKGIYASSFTGSELVPSVIDETSIRIPDIIKTDTKSRYWRKGRNWNQKRQGVAQETGYYTTIPEKQIESLKQDYKLIWQIFYGRQLKYIDCFEQKEIKNENS